MSDEVRRMGRGLGHGGEGAPDSSRAVSERDRR